MTASQIAAINSGITSTLVTKLNGIESGAQVNTVDSVNSKTGVVVLDADDIDDTNTTNKFVTITEKNTWNGKQDELVSGTNIKSINFTSLLGTGNIDTTELYFCTYGITTSTEISNAIANGKLIIAFDGEVPYFYSGTWSQFYTFSRLYNINYTNAYSLYLNQSDNSWSRSGAVGLQRTGNLVTSISSSSTNSQYPSAKCVYDELVNVREIAEGKTASYVCSDVTNTILNSQNDTITISSSLTDINSQTIALSDLNIGDTIYITETDVPDRWVSNITAENNTITGITLSKLETAKVPINSISVNSSAITPVNGNVDITVPTTTSQLTNNSNYTTIDEVNSSNSKNPISSQIALLKNQNEQWAESVKDFELSELSNVDIVFKSTLVGDTTTNHYHTGNIRYCTIVGLFKDDNNYISLYNNGYKVSIKLKLNGSDVYNVDLGSSAAGTPYCYAASYGATLDLHNKVAKVKIINNDILTDIYSYDFSTWDISSLTQMKIVTSLGDYTTGTELVYLKVNGITNFDTLLRQCLEYGSYQAFPTFLPIPFYNVAITGVTCDGTLVEDLGAFHKIYDVDVGSSKNYIKLGPTGTSAEMSKRGPVICRIKFKILSKSADMYWDYGITVEKTSIYQGDTLVQNLG